LTASALIRQPAPGDELNLGKTVPNVTIEVRKHYTKQQEEGVIDAVHAALMEGIKTPAWDRTIRLVVHEPHRFATPPDKDERYTLVDIDLFPGRSLDAKKALYRAIVDQLEKFGIPAEHVKVLLRESAAQNWGVRGGVPASEVDLGFKVDV
jgi:phenylpyruvate tautomerase PptA (4-oxalocrotonate tautomerase family)